jgi:hypothetical protein
MTLHIASKRNRTHSAHLLAHIYCTINQPLTTYCIDTLAYTLDIISVQKTNKRRYTLPLKILSTFDFFYKKIIKNQQNQISPKFKKFLVLYTIGYF